MGYRAITFLGINIFLTTIISLLFILQGRTLYHIPQTTQVLVVTTGIIVGAFFGGVIARKELRSLTQKGEYKPSLTLILLVIGTILIALAFASYFVYTLPLNDWVIVPNLLWPMLPAISTARMILYVKWEKKYRRIILSGSLFTSRIYVFPSIEQKPTYMCP